MAHRVDLRRPLGWRRDSSGIGAPQDWLAPGETGPSFADFFFHSALAGTPSQCELQAYVQMPGATPGVLDHDLGRYCLVPRGEAIEVTPGPCAVMIEAPDPQRAHP